MVVEVDAIVAVDLINVFVDGRLGSDKFRSVVTETKKVIKKSNLFTILVQDEHDINDPEISVWGEHAMKGSQEAETVLELRGIAKVIKKSTYDAFYNTELEQVLHSKKARNVLFCGVVTDICIVHSVASAFFRGFHTTVARECTATYSETVKNRALEYMTKNYGTRVISVEEMLEE